MVKFSRSIWEWEGGGRGCALRTHAEMEIGHEVITDKFVDGIVADGPQTGDNNCWNGFVVTVGGLYRAPVLFRSRSSEWHYGEN